ncbi:alpha-1B adrenergic receptor [Astyanax mexicanus]|uniref:alpha-1B adrenergic receptor n=1 Tax=Astyanax mexicanus TaxID=7994 RepID=UPI0020CA9D42|nr:alpha-1B adrenergic receptor [Astyanax mexicanus]
MDAEGWIKSVIRGLMCVSGIIGNHWLGFSALPKSRAHLKTNDILFVNLASSNLITNYLVDLPDMMDFTYNFLMGQMYCSVFNFCSDLSETSSIFTTLFITVFWHQKLVGSLKRGGAPVQLDNIRLVAALLAGSWIVAIAFSLPHIFLASKNNGNNTYFECLEDYPSLEAKQAYDLMYLVFANIIPIIGIFFTSIQITVTLLQNQKRINSNTTAVTTGAKNTKITPAEPSLHSNQSSQEAVRNSNAVVPNPGQARSSSSSGSVLRAAKSVVTVATIFLICWVVHVILRLISTIQESSLIMELASYIGAAYTCIIPYIYLHGVKKFSCTCRG